MDPASLSVAAGAVLASIDWKRLGQALATDAANKSVKALLGRLGSNDRERAAKKAIELFIHEFLSELEDKTALTSSLPGYQDQLKRLIESAAEDIAIWLQPDTRDVDLSSVEHMWNGLGLVPLPQDFDWTLVAKSYGRAIRTYIKSDPALRGVLDTSLRERQIQLQERSVELLTRIAGREIGLDLPGYRKYLLSKCATVQLSSIQASTSRRQSVELLSIFIPQSAREAIPVRDISPTLLRQLRQEGQIAHELSEFERARFRWDYERSTISPVLDTLARRRQVVILGDPGAGKTSLLKFMAMRWATQEPACDDAGTMPVWIDLKEYAQERTGLVKYFETGRTVYGLDASQVEKRLNEGTAALYLDALDEIFDGPTRRSVIEEIAAVAARYDRAQVLVTSRILGYDADRLSSAGFAHVTLEDFDQAQVSEFLTRWYGVAEEDSRERLRLGRKLVQATQESRVLGDLASNPLLLTVMAILNRDQDLPRDRIALYAQMSRLMLHDWDASRSLPVEILAWQEKAELLRVLAGIMQQDTGLSENLIDRARLVDLCRTFLSNLGVRGHYEKAISLIKELTERNFVLSYAGADRFSFVHRTFLEYFCASWIVDLYDKRTLTLLQIREDVYGKHWKDESWHEVLLLVAGMVDEKSVENIIQFLMDQDGSDAETANLMLAAGCFGEVRNRGAIRGVEEVLWERFVTEVVRYDAPPGQARKKPYQLIPIRERAARLIASVWGSTRGGVWLRVAAIADPDPLLRTAAMDALVRGRKEDPETLQIVKKLAHSDADLSTQSAAVRAFAREWKSDQEALPLIRSLACADRDRPTFVQRTAIGELARCWPDDPETFPLLKALAQPGSNYYVRAAALEELARGWGKDPEIYSMLIRVIRSDENSYVRRFAIYALAENWKNDPDTLIILKDVARSDKDQDVALPAAGGLIRCWKTNAEALIVAREFISSDLDEEVRALMVGELARRWKDDPETLPTLKNLIRSDPSERVRMSAAYAFVQGWMSDVLF
ncbi:MAG TPA: HEAT repeat domain-containing protein [Bryobacteraceae bacterium]|nr:HEAT repeat domain-containing protein [Bryobacteraceae bacterium]